MRGFTGKLEFYAVSMSGQLLSTSALDFWMGLLIRILALVAAGLFVAEVQLPPWMDREYAHLSPRDRGGPDRAGLLRPDLQEDKDIEVPLEPAAVQEKPKALKATGVLESVAMIAIYMSAAIGIVYLNAYILTQWPWAATLTMLQMLFCSIAARGCVFAGLSDPAKVGMTPRHYVTICVPLALLYTFYLYGSNAVYDYLPVGYIQLLKPGQAIGVYILLAMAGKEAVSMLPVLNLAVILGAVIVASVAKSEVAGWSTAGFMFMMVSNACYSFYLVGQQLVLNTSLGGGKHASKLDAITTLYFLGPATAMGLAVVAAATEWGQADFRLTSVSPWFLLCDCIIAFSLNLIQINIIGKLSALSYMFAGYAKGFLTVVISVVFYKEAVDGLEITGYIVMLFGQLLWSLRKLRARLPQADREDAGLNFKLGVVFSFLVISLIYSLTVDACLAVPCQ